MSTLTGLDEVVARAVVRLKERLVAGHYGLTCVGSDGTPRFSDNKGHVFCGFFIAEALEHDVTEIERTILLVRILSEENDGLWGFSPPAPYISPEHEVFVVDADDSAYVLRTLRRLGVNRSPRGLLAFHRERANLFVTFNGSGDTRLIVPPSPEHNLLAHPEVNANVFLALRGTRLEHHINYDLVRDAQATNGYWPSYFYPSHFFATDLFLDLIHDQEWLAEYRARGLAFLVASQHADGSWGEPGNPFDTALACHALASCEHRGEHLRRGLASLVDTQRADGGWHSERSVWEFHADPTDIWRAYDAHGTLTSALCIRALRRGLNLLG